MAQRIVVFQQRGSGADKIREVRARGRDLVIAEVVDIDDDLPEVIDDASPWLPERPEADLVLDYLRHPDLRLELAGRCRAAGIPVIASGAPGREQGVVSPPTCCGLARRSELGAYAEQFGAPELEVQVDKGRVAAVRVVRGAPCGASREAARKVVGLPPEEAAVRYGLEVQMHCKADPAGWDPLHDQSPVHFAGRVHAEAFRRALASA